MAKAVEPDQGFYIEHAANIDAREDLDLTSTPPPDLVVEIDLSRRSLDRLQIYAALGVPEVWRYDNRALTCYVLGMDGNYALSQTSRSFPGLPLADFAEFISGWATVGENAFIKSFRGWIGDRVV